MLSLVVQTGKHKGKVIALPDREVVIGRDETCFIRMTSGDVSRQHCSLTPTSKGMLVRDLGSQNGTVVNGVKIDGETLIHPGDYLQVGALQFQFAGPKIDKEPGSGTSEEDIFGWLSDTAIDIPNASDTTIVKATELHPVPAKPEPKPVFKTVGEEARDIIRRHLESLQKPDSA